MFNKTRSIFILVSILIACVFSISNAFTIPSGTVSYWDVNGQTIKIVTQDYLLEMTFPNGEVQFFTVSDDPNIGAYYFNPERKVYFYDDCSGSLSINISDGVYELKNKSCKKIKENNNDSGSIN